MQKTIDSLSNTILGIRGGTVSTGLVDSVKVLAYGQPTLIKHLAITGKNGDSIFIDPYDITLTNQIAKTLADSGLSAYAFSKTRVLVSVPPPSGDQKKEIISRLKKLGEEAKIAIRNIRKKHRQSLDKDTLNQKDKEIQEITDSFISIIDNLIDNKIRNL